MALVWKPKDFGGSQERPVWELANAAGIVIAFLMLALGFTMSAKPKNALPSASGSASTPRYDGNTKSSGV